MDYNNRYPPEFESFTPVCDEIPVSNCERQSLINTYDNSMLYTDKLLSDVIDFLKGFENTNTMMMYMPDHGESLGEDGVYAHAALIAFAPKEQVDVPFLLWMSPSFADAQALDLAKIPRNIPNPNDYVFHSFVSIFGLQSPVYKPQFDLFAPAR
jgi:lipid A ethanolaminephosphotransferase